ncbi:MAG: hypothetical protein ABH859_01115 [Pseudomonadota bacterium]
MHWYILFGVLLVLAIALVGYFYVSERKYLAKKSSEVMRPEIKQDLDYEREQALRRKEKFQQAIHKAKEQK